MAQEMDPGGDPNTAPLDTHGGVGQFDPNGPGAETLAREFRIPSFGQGETKDHYTPFLVLRYGPADGGGRPLAAGTVFWNSSDVWVTSPLGYNLPVAGEPAHPFARVSNGGMQDASGVVVRWWWANPSLAIIPANAHLIGSTTAFVPSGNSVVVSCPDHWVPVMENQGHECLIAEAFLSDADPLTAPLNPVADRHVCQKNLHVLELQPGQDFAFKVGAQNTAKAAQRVEIHARALPFAEVRAALTAPDIAFPRPLVETAGALPLGLAWAPAGGAAVPAGTGAGGGGLGRLLGWLPRLLLRIVRFVLGLFGIRLGGGKHPAAVAPGAVVTTTAAFGPGEARGVELRGRVPAGAKPGQAFGYDVHERIGGQEVTGGYTLYVVVKG